LNVEVLSARQATETRATLRLDIVGAVYFRDDCHLIPARFMTVLKQQLVKLGVSSCGKTELTGWRLNGNSNRGRPHRKGRFHGRRIRALRRFLVARSRARVAGSLSRCRLAKVTA